jgi:hypothetical protein
MSTPFLGLPVFAATTWPQDPIAHVLRQLGRPVVALVALLTLEAGMMFAIGEVLAIDHYRKGLAHFHKERQAEWSIASGGGADFHIDYAPAGDRAADEYRRGSTARDPPVVGRVRLSVDRAPSRGLWRP